jgi:anaerobic dimethyl sulfoxide reductase subunit B (iron-sulfur subunit)
LNELQWSFVFRQENCIQCHGCEGACKAWRKVAHKVKWRRVINLWQGSYPDVTCKTATVSCMHCAQPLCVVVCPQSAIEKRPDGTVTVDQGKCIGCQACFAACPFGVPQYGASGLMEKCDLCAPASGGEPETPPCVRMCPTGALELKKLPAKEKKDNEQSLLHLLRTGAPEGK